MTARLVPTATEAEWLEARRQGVTASEIAVILGLSPYSSPYALYHRKAGNLPEPEQTDAMALGKHMESFVAAEFARRRPELHLWGDGTVLFAHPDRPWQMATPDRGVTEGPLIDGHEPLAVLECKIDGGSDEWGDDGTDEIPVHYRCQVLWQMDVLGVGTGFVACLLWNRRKVRIYELSMDEQARADLELMRAEAEYFLRRLHLGIEPEPDWRPATADALKQLHPSLDDTEVRIPRGLAARYKAACRAAKAADRRKKAAENLIRARLGPASRAVIQGLDGPVTIASRQVYEVREHTRRACTVDKLVPKGSAS